MENQELNEKLALWRGFIHETAPDLIQMHHHDIDAVWYLPRDACPIKIDWVIECPDFTHSTDLCFKWLMPDIWICEMKLLDGIFYKWKVACPRYKGYGEAMEEQPALGLSKAIGNMIDNGSK